MAVTSPGTAIVQTSRGAVRGVVEGGIARFLGVPFAAPPFGENRFEPPRPHEPWAGELDATRLGPTPPQTPYEGIYARLLPSTQIDGDEILNLNVWTPAEALEGPPLPVMVWIYGGALIHGSNAWPMYDGTPFARDGLVYVALNYRVGVEGFGLLDGAPPNRGFADIIAGLDWVRQEIHAFGGDPGNVTVFGQSAGGALVISLLAAPAAAGLFHKAIAMSAGMGPAPPLPERTLTTAISEDLAIPQTKAAFARRSPAQLVNAESRVLRGAMFGATNLYYRLVDGDELLPAPVWTALESGAGDEVSVLVGATAAEGRFWYAPELAPSAMTPDVVEAVLVALGINDADFEVYRRNRPGASAATVYGDFILDLVIRPGLNRFADRRAASGVPTWAYDFGWQSPVLGLGAAHCVDLPFLFDNLDGEWSRALVGDRAPQRLADEFHGAFVRFAATGDPGWKAWDSTRPFMTFDAAGGRVVEDPRRDERVVLAGYLR